MPKLLGVTGRAARANGPGDEPTAAGCPMRGNSGWKMCGTFQALRHFFSGTISASSVTRLLCPFLRYIDTVKKNQKDRRTCRFWFRNGIFEYQIKPFWTELPCVHWNLSQSAYLLYLVLKRWHFSCIYKIKLTRPNNKNLMQKWWTKVYGSIARVADRLLARHGLSNPSRDLSMRVLSVLTLYPVVYNRFYRDPQQSISFRKSTAAHCGPRPGSFCQSSMWHLLLLAALAADTPRRTESSRNIWNSCRF